MKKKPKPSTKTSSEKRKAPKKKAIEAKIVPEGSEHVERIYSNFCAIRHTPFDFSLEFYDIPPLSEKAAEETQRTHELIARFRSKIVIAPDLVPKLISALEENWDTYQRSFGKLKIKSKKVEK